MGIFTNFGTKALVGGIVAGTAATGFGMFELDQATHRDNLQAQKGYDKAVAGLSPGDTLAYVKAHGKRPSAGAGNIGFPTIGVLVGSGFIAGSMMGMNHPEGPLSDVMSGVGLVIGTSLVSGSILGGMAGAVTTPGGYTPPSNYSSLYGY